MSDRRIKELDSHIIAGPVANEFLDCAADALYVLALIGSDHPEAKRVEKRLQNLLAMCSEVEVLLEGALPMANWSDPDLKQMAAAKRLSEMISDVLKVR